MVPQRWGIPLRPITGAAWVSMVAPKGETVVVKLLAALHFFACKRAKQSLYRRRTIHHRNMLSARAQLPALGTGSTGRLVCFRPPCTTPLRKHRLAITCAAAGDDPFKVHLP